MPPLAELAVPTAHIRAHARAAVLASTQTHTAMISCQDVELLRKLVRDLCTDLEAQSAVKTDAPPNQPLCFLQVRWVWLIIVSCSMFLTFAIVAAVGAFAAAAFAVLPRHLYTLAIVPVAVGMCSIVIVLGWLIQSTWATKPSKMLGFIGWSEPVWLSWCRGPISKAFMLRASSHGGVEAAKGSVSQRVSLPHAVVSCAGSCSASSTWLTSYCATILHCHHSASRRIQHAIA